MNESVGYTVTINIITTFIIIVFVFISNVLIYYKSNKVGNVIVDSIEKYSGFNALSEREIDEKLNSIGYNKRTTSCKNDDNCTLESSKIDEGKSTSEKGYCVYYCENSEDYYYYKIKSNMIINIPIINDVVNASVFSSTTNMYDFKSPIEYMSGDVNKNGYLDSDDAAIIMRIVELGELDIENIDFELADANGDGIITKEDADLISQKLANAEYYY